MPALKDLEIGVMFWAERDDLSNIKSMGVRCGQLGVAEETSLTPSLALSWKEALRADDFALDLYKGALLCSPTINYAGSNEEALVKRAQALLASAGRGE